MEFIETAVFTERISILLDDREYHLLQCALIRAPLQGRVIPGTSGLRKIRWRAEHRGKRGGIRVIYYYEADESIYFIYAYDKVRRGDLTHAQLKAFAQLMSSGG